MKKTPPIVCKKYVYLVIVTSAKIWMVLKRCFIFQFILIFPCDFDKIFDLCITVMKKYTSRRGPTGTCESFKCIHLSPNVLARLYWIYCLHRGFRLYRKHINRNQKATKHIDILYGIAVLVKMIIWMILWMSVGFRLNIVDINNFRSRLFFVL